MSCPDWRSLARSRAAEPLCDPAGFDAALLHLQSCRDCRQAAFAADPLLLFHSGARPAASVTPSENAAEVAAMQGSVLALVRASRVAGGAGLASRGRRLTGLKIAASLALISLLALSGGPGEADREPPGGAAGANLAAWIEDTALGSDVARPVVEELEQPGARIYELPQDDVAVVMIVDASLDV